MRNENKKKNGIDHVFFSAMQQIKANQLDDNISETTLESHANDTIHKFINSP